jgi:hypothetical protein
MALGEYVPTELIVLTVQFIASDEPVSTMILDDPRLGWQDIARNKWAVLRARWNHSSMLGAEHSTGKLEELLRPDMSELTRAASV